MSQARDFNWMTPGRDVTDPQNIGTGSYQEYPRHVHKYGVLPRVVTTDDDKAEALASGWSLVPVLEAPPLKKARSAE